MASAKDDASVIASSGAPLTSAAQRRPSKASKERQAGSSGTEIINNSPMGLQPEATTPPKKELPVISWKALTAVVVLSLVVAVNMQYGAYKDRLALDIPPLDKDYALHKMLQWMEAGGAKGALPPSAKIEVRDDLGACQCIRGVAATRDIEFLETILELPFDQIIFDAQEQPLPACTSDAQWDVRLATALLREKARGPASPFFYYIQALPDEIVAAVTLDDEDLDKVKYAVGRSKLAAQRPWMEKLWIRCLEQNPELIAHANWHEFRWAIAVVQSRSFSLLGALIQEQPGNPLSGKRRSNGSGLVPLMDLLNHHETQSAYWETSPNGQSVLLKAFRNISAGEEVCVSYGKKGNDELLISYGFVTRGNEHDYMALFDTVDAAVDWLFEKLPCRNAPAGEVVSRAPECREKVIEMVRERLEGVSLHPVVEAMKADAATEYYVNDIERMCLFVNGTDDTRLVAAFEAAFAQPCFLCARESPPGVSGDAHGIQFAIDEAKKLVARASAVGASGEAGSELVKELVDLAVKLRVLELLEPFGITFGNEDVNTWRRPTLRELPSGLWKDQVLKEYNDSKLKLLLGRLDAMVS